MSRTNKVTGKSWLRLLGRTRKARIISTSALFLAACAFGAAGVVPLAPDPSDLPVKSISQELPLPSLADQVSALEQVNQHFIHEERVRSGDTLATLLNRLGIDDNAAADFIKNDQVGRGVMHLKVGRTVRAETDEVGNLMWLRATAGDARDGAINTLSIQRTTKGFAATEAPATLERRIEMRSREITSSLYAATDASTDGSRLPDSVVAQLIEMFSTDIDFRTDLKRGDRFSVVYESFWQDGELVRNGRVLAGEFTNKGVTYQAMWYEDPAGKTSGGYYTSEGKSVRRAFLKSPLEFSRITSGMGMRVHPISGNWKQHKGIDYGAAVGTPIRAAADGTVDFAGVQGGYGNMVVLKHWANYSTAYAHMSRFAAGLRKGQKVSQGDVIGYVGTTGWSTGPHLHYEFRVAGEARDPAKMALTPQAPLTAAELARFKLVSGEMNHRFAVLSPQQNPAGRNMAAR